ARKKKYGGDKNNGETQPRTRRILHKDFCKKHATRKVCAAFFNKHIFSLSIFSKKLSPPPPAFCVPLTIEFLKANPFLILDTKFFGQEFKDRLLASFENLDEQTDGLLIHSENFQALNLLQERYREQVKCIYIDPPYNTGPSEII